MFYGILFLIAAFFLFRWISTKKYSPPKKSSSETIPSKVWDNHLSVFLAGVHVKGRKKYIINNLYEGYELKLVPEPTNRVDPDAIKVVDPFDGRDIGYVVGDKTHLVHPILKKDHVVTIGEMIEEDSFSNPGDIHLKVYLDISYNS